MEGGTPAMTSEAAKSTKNDPAWNHNYCADPNNQNAVTCIYHGKETNGGIYRAKLHQIGGDRNAKAYLKCPEDVKKLLKDYMQSKKDAKINYDKLPEHHDLDAFHDLEDDDTEVEELETDSRGHFKRIRDVQKGKAPVKKGKHKRTYGCFYPQKARNCGRASKQGRLKQLKIDEKLDKQRREVAIQYICNMFYHNGIPFNVARSHSFKCAVEAIGQYGPNLKPPSYHEVRVTSLKKEVANMRDMLAEHRALWVKHGCSIMADGWTSTTGQCIVNFLVHSLAGCVFVKSVDASAYSKTGAKVLELLDGFVEYVGEANVVQVVTDNGPNFKLGGKLLETKRPNIYWTPCGAHCIDLMLEDIGKLPLVLKTLRRAMSLTSFIYNRVGLLNLMRRYTGQRNLIRPGKTRLCTCYLTLKSIYKQKANLRAMFSESEWNSSKWKKEAGGKQVEDCMMKPTFWDNAYYILKLMGPLVKTLRLVDNERKPAMGYIYEAMDRAKEAIIKAFNGRDDNDKETFKIIDSRWQDQLHHPLHAAGHYLNPAFFMPIRKLNSIVRSRLDCMLA
ncbi:unnamed protein product [Cuscuta europaea]|nr:unnamed protein product [Cuscuta europaea]